MTGFRSIVAFHLVYRLTTEPLQKAMNPRIGDEIVHDPHPSRAGLLELRYFEVLVAVL